MSMIAPIAEAADGLAMAMVASSHSPILLLDGDLRIVAASASFCRTFRIDALDVAGRPLSELGGGEWEDERLEALLAAALAMRVDPVDDYEMDLKRSGRETRRLVLHVHKLIYGDSQNVRLLLEVSDVTEARFDQRFTEKVVREKILLVEEMQHRVANSLQIIASLLIQSARRVASDETRSYLYDAHQRVMSVASLQHHLSVTRLGDVELRSYLVDLCGSISESMIHDRERLSLEVRAEPCVTTADTSTNIGLMVTELVINAIKHAFPRKRRGRIVVHHEANGSAWTITVADDGIGMPLDPASAAPGLGSNIIKALAAQLGAEINIASAEPGTMVTITHSADSPVVQELVLEAM